MEEKGVVKSIDGVNACVVVTKKTACEHCTAGTCHLTGEGAIIEAINAAHARVGQQVRVVMKPVAYLTGALMIWGVPALALIIGAVAGTQLAKAFVTGIAPESGGAIGAFGLMALSLIVVRVWSRRAEHKAEYKPVIEDILEDNESQ
jgi:sigma-E factor negative regulatory protein RseC